MTSSKLKLDDFGVYIDEVKFVDQITELFNQYTKGSISFEEMLLRSDTAKQFCDDARMITGYFNLPDEIVLRSVKTKSNPRLLGNPGNSSRFLGGAYASIEQ